MDIRVQVLDFVFRDFAHLVDEGRLALRVFGGTAAAVARVGQVAVAVDVHVCEGVGPVQEDGLVGDGFLAVGPFCVGDV